MDKERAVLAGGCFWGVQDLIRSYDGVLSTRVGYTGGSNSHATYGNHPGHAEAVEIIFDPSPHQLSANPRILLPDSRPEHAQSTGQRRREQLSVGDLLHQRRAKADRRRHDRRRRCFRPVAGQGCDGSGSSKRLLGGRTRASGLPPTNIPAATPAISSGPTGSCRLAPRRL